MLRYDLPCIIRKDVFYFLRKHIFSLEGKWEMIFFKKYVGDRCFLCTPTGVTNVTPRSSVKKNQRWSYPAKMHLKMINVLDWHPRKSSSNSLCFHEDLSRRFHILLSSEKNMKLNIWGWSLTSSSIYSVEDILQWIIFNALNHSALRICVWRCAWALIKEIICPLGDGL